MKIPEFVELVREMRAAQKKAENNFAYSVNGQKKALEKQVDDAVRNFIKFIEAKKEKEAAKQIELF